ncbi:MAG: hypothetical protein ACRDH6_03925 [Actinomycetota bacterium]
MTVVFFRRAIALILATMSLVAFGYNLDELANGIVEVPFHWWSAAPVLGVGLAILIGAGPELLRWLNARSARD